MVADVTRKDIKNMNELNDLMITSIITVVIAIITAWITGKFTFKSDIKKYLHSKREEIYISLFELLDQLISDQTLIYDDEFKSSLIKFKPRLKLIASKSVIRHFEILYKLFMRYQVELEQFKVNEDPVNKPYAIEQKQDEDGEIYEICHVTEDEFNLYDYKVDEFQNVKIEQAQEFIDYINSLANQMCIDIGNTGYKWNN